MAFGRLADVIGRTQVYWISAAIMVLAAIGSALSLNLAMLVAFGPARVRRRRRVPGQRGADERVLHHTNRGRDDRAGLFRPGRSASSSATLTAPGPARRRCQPGPDLAPPAWPRCHPSGRRRLAAPHDARAAPVSRSGPPAAPCASGRAGAPGEPHAPCDAGRNSGLLVPSSTTPTTATRSPPRRSSPSSPPHASQTATIAIELAIFVVAAVPGYLLAIARMDRIGHRRLQFVGFVAMAACSRRHRPRPRHLTTVVVPFLLAYGISYFFTEFGPNMTHLRPARRTVPHPAPFPFPATVSPPVSGKLGAFIGVVLVPVLQGTLGLRGTLLLTAGISVLGALLTLVPARARRPDPRGDLRRGRRP